MIVLSIGGYTLRVYPDLQVRYRSKYAGPLNRTLHRLATQSAIIPRHETFILYPVRRLSCLLACACPARFSLSLESSGPRHILRVSSLAFPVHRMTGLPCDRVFFWVESEGRFSNRIRHTHPQQRSLVSATFSTIGGTLRLYWTFLFLTWSNRVSPRGHRSIFIFIV